MSSPSSLWDKPDPVLNKADKLLPEHKPNLENILDCDVTCPKDPVLHNPTDYSDLTRPLNTFEPHTFDPSLQLDSDTSDKLSINQDTPTILMTQQFYTIPQTLIKQILTNHMIDKFRPNKELQNKDTHLHQI